MLSAYAPILRGCPPYLVLTRRYRELVGPLPFGLRIRDENRIDPHDVDQAPFLNLLQRLDALTYGPRGLEMPRWVFYDCAEMVGGIFGFGRPARSLAPWVRSALEVPEDYQGLVPLSMVILIPMLPEAAFLGYTLCSLNQVAPGAGPAGLRVLTQAAAMHLFRVGTLYGTTQWRSPTLDVHARFAPLEVLTTYTPAHSVPATLTFRYPLDEGRVARALGTPRPPPRARLLLDADDEAAMRRLQRKLEAGAGYRILAPPRRHGASILVPLGEGR